MTFITSPIAILLYFQTCLGYKYEIFRKVRRIYRMSFNSKIMRIYHCFFAPQVFRHNNPRFQKLQNWADLWQHSVNDKGEGSRPTQIGLVNRGKIRVNEQKRHSAFLCAEHLYFQDRHLFSSVDPLLLCYRELNMGRVALIWCFSDIFKPLIANLTRGTATLQNEILTVLRFCHSL